MASVLVMTLSDGSIRIFDSLDAIASLSDVKTVTELAGGHAVATMRDGLTLPIRRVPLEGSFSPETLSPPPPLQRCESVVSLGIGPFADDATSPLLASVFARTSPFGTSPLPDAALRTPERNKLELECPGAPSRIVRVSPKRARDLAATGARVAAALAAEADGSASSGVEVSASHKE
jgi:hypothetical protein